MAMYLAVMCAFFAGLDALTFALYVAVIMCVGLYLHHTSWPIEQERKPYQPFQAVLPSFSESMAELNALQQDINQLQKQFAAETYAIVNRNLADGSAG